MKKRAILSIVMALVLCLGAASTAFAAVVPLRTAKVDEAGANVLDSNGNFITDETVVETSAIALVDATNAGGYQLINAKQVNKKIKKNADVVIVDTMPADFYNNKGHIPTAVNAEAPLTADEFTKAQKKALIKAVGKDKNQAIIVYCGFVKCTRSDTAAAYLVSKGYKNVYRMPGGSAAWEDAGYAFE